MAYKLRDRDLKDNRGFQKRASISEDIQNREMMETILKELQQMQEKQDAYQKLAQEQMLDFKREIKEELKEVKQDISALNQELRNLERDKKELKRAHEKLQEEVKAVELKSNKMEERQERMEAKELEFQLRFRNVWEEPKENIRKKMTEIISKLLQCSEEEMEDKMDRVYRINTNFARRNKTARDTIVNFTKKIFRDEILRMNNGQPIIYKGKKIAVLKEFPSEVINRRRKYTFLVEELKRYNVRFRWERPEGLMATYQEQKFWITSEEKAKAFLKRLKGDMEKQDIGENEDSRKMRERERRLRAESQSRKDITLDLPGISSGEREDLLAAGKIDDEAATEEEEEEIDE
ncbi:uncharacterized protein PF3D7_1120000-like [Anolis carolinensis]|uniref:uncharacterized protein PF3D7_1120000-like n=1 Tax=Anolis carolinensis TaxID=28377 RepID=UPI000462A500|nr:PREDICTED: uncharacterized protein PF11_0207-like [Anolis carolinensis]|eukprot:XP_008108054.1 PREDICTED: uncharacterized protein PF11_0207-like [Anolis carolinensis]